jgi:hypothetical protein
MLKPWNEMTEEQKTNMGVILRSIATRYALVRKDMERLNDLVNKDAFGIIELEEIIEWFDDEMTSEVVLTDVDIESFVDEFCDL